MDGMAKNMSKFSASARAGEFTVNQHGGDAILAAIRTMQDWYQASAHKLNQLAQEPKLGSSNNAKIMAPLLVQVATDHQGFLTQLEKFNDVLTEAEESIKIAMANYRNADDDAQGKFTT
ncbi:hypothetical protein [Actinokineospora iranica]|uniref:Excreted virulence factor EspC, type VII ESX diderm n=1 Tax=Actinokineospora iranica TaxID=1271860 RepID=A0A1G6PP38_9PSEU|nr:hypothetical protein [Actinokineospora iranica]SDC81798.1 hypothetical protein SAMN05216174_104402 [Actinokineospora iranica]